MRYVLVGGGLTTARAAEAMRTMRTSGFEGEIVLVEAERELPYLIQPASFYSDNRIALEPASLRRGHRSDMARSGGSLRPPRLRLPR